MTDEEEFAARSQLKWAREGDAWILLYRRRRMGRVVPDRTNAAHQTCCRRLILNSYPVTSGLP
jgi:hypothetical protein